MGHKRNERFIFGKTNPIREVDPVSWTQISSLGGKWLELLSEIAPGLKRVAIMFNPDNPIPVSALMPSLETAARSLKIAPNIAPVHSEAEIETSIIALGHEPGGGLVVMPNIFTLARGMQIIPAVARNNVPTDSIRNPQTFRRPLPRTDHRTENSELGAVVRPHRFAVQIRLPRSPARNALSSRCDPFSESNVVDDHGRWLALMGTSIWCLRGQVL